MRFNVNTEIALTYLSSRKKQTLVAAMGVTFGISMFIFLQSLMKGTNDYFEKSSFSSIPHIRIYNDNKVADFHLLNGYFKDSSVKILDNPKQLQQYQGLINPYGLVKEISKQPDVVAVTPQVTVNAFYNSGSVQLNGIVNGVDILAEDRMFDLTGYMLQGEVRNLLKVDNGIIIGKGIADKLSLHMYDNISITSATGGSKVMRIVGIYATTIKQIDETKSYVNISQAQSLLGKDRSYVTDIKVNIKEYNNAPSRARDLEAITGYKAEDWVQSNAQLKAAFKIRAVILNSVIGVILLVAGFGIYNILNMTIYEKIKEIAILKATGFPGKAVTSIFLQQAIYIGLLGAFTGIIIGFFITLMVSRIYIGAGSLKYLPMSFYIPHYIEAVTFGVLTTIAAGYFPARKAAKVDPVIIIRG
ncbi:MAG: FtsX-like permease family protein [Bacteroidota bacterium]